MKRLLAAIITVSILGIAVLGFLSMAHENDHNIGNCIGFVTGVVCPTLITSFFDTARHIAAIQGLSLGALISFLTLGALFIAIWFVRQKVWNMKYPPATLYAYIKKVKQNVLSLIRLNKWLARHEARDPHAHLWVHEFFGYS